ncbi:MAG: biotin/lipoyl-containing protein, partial [Thermoleophilia bacterium]|nr:biotin/lipoyl-containing protein [Thermoleophilia bacterium]
MARALKLPDLGEGLSEGEIARWLVAEGQVIAEDDPLVEIQTDKATVEIPSPWAGTVLRILVAEGEIVPVGAELVLIGEPEKEPPVERDGGESRRPRDSEQGAPGLPAPPSELAVVGHVRATPLVR